MIFRLLPATFGVVVALLVFSGCKDDPLRVGGFCGSEADCPPSQVCAGGICASTCAGDSDCDEGFACVDDVCMPRCETGRECRAGGAIARACGEGVCRVTEPPGLAQAGDDRLASEGEVVSLDARDSDPFDDGVSYEWELVSSNPKGLLVTLEQGAADAVAGPLAVFTAPSVVEDTTLLFQLTMTDGEGNVATDTVEVLVQNTVNEAPTATIAASGTEVQPGDVVTVSAEGAADPNPGDELTYEWSATVDGAEVKVEVSEDGTSITFVAPALPEGAEVVVTLTVSDGEDTTTIELTVIVGAACTADSCDDGDPCTTDTCAGTGCVSTPLTGEPCDDGDACTTDDACADGACKGSPVDCNDGNSCTDDSCDGGGCLHAAVPGCTGGCEPAACDDDNPCTTDACGENECTHTPIEGACDDGDLCTSGDACVSGKCVGVEMDCDDGDPCTADSCDGGACVNDLAGGCDDGDPCTVDDTCTAAGCAGVPMACDDGDPCTDDSCDLGVCAFAPNTAPCDDGDPCTIKDICTDGACVAGAMACDDGNPCTTDLCAPGEPVSCSTASLPVASACGAAGLCGFDAVCRQAAIRSFEPKMDVPGPSWLTGASEQSGALVTSGASQPSGATAGGPAGYVLRLPEGGPAVTEHSGPGWLLAIAQGLAVGEVGKTVAYSVEGWAESSGAPGKATLTSVWRGEQGTPGSPQDLHLLGLDDPAAQASVGFCAYGGLECWTDAYFEAAPRVRGVWGVTSIFSGEGVSLETETAWALAEGKTSLIMARPLFGDWSDAAPLGCDGAPGSACAGVLEWRDITGPLTGKVVWAAADSGRLLQWSSDGWAAMPPGGLPADAPKGLDLRALAAVGDHLFAVAEVPGCGAGKCIADSTQKSLFLLHHSQDQWHPAVVLLTRKCLTPTNPDQCLAELALLTARDVTLTTGGQLAVVGADLAVVGGEPLQRMLSIEVRLSPEKGLCGDGLCGPSESCELCEQDCGACVGASCKGACGDQAPGGCWCDSLCLSSGDCCPDACEQCDLCPF